MRLERLRTPGFALFVALATACTSEASPAPTAAPDPTSESAIDRSADPCKDFYRYACGAWLDAHEGQRAVRITTSLYKEVPLVQSILEDDLGGRRAADDPYAAVVGAYLRACLAAPSSASGRQALTSELSRIDAIASVDDLVTQVAVQRDVGSLVLVGVATQVDFHDPSRRIVTLDQLGGELPDRSYYLDPSLEGLRTRYRAHVAAVAAELGGAFDADAAIAVETALAKASLARTERRDARALDHPMTLTELDAAAPGLPWKRLLTAAGFEGVERVNAAVPSYLTAVAAYVAATPLDTLKSYLKWQLVHDSMLALDAPLRALDFAFFQRTVRGLDQPPSTDWVCLTSAMNVLGDAIVGPYLARRADAGELDLARSVVERVRASATERVETTAWLDAPSREVVRSKLETVRADIGGPAVLASLDGLEVNDSSMFYARAAIVRFRHQQAIAELAEPVDRGRWSVSPMAWDLWYSRTTNAVAAPAIFVAPLVRAARGSDPALLGALGAMLAHELGHGLDDSDRRFDAEGALRETWSDASVAAFDERASCVVKQFDGYSVDGDFTLGEDLADLGGLRFAFEAAFPDGPPPAAAEDKRSPAQIFFLSWAQAQCETIPAGYADELARTDPHAPSRARVNLPLANMPELAEAFACKRGSPMAPQERCEVW